MRPQNAPSITVPTNTPGPEGLAWPSNSPSMNKAASSTSIRRCRSSGDRDHLKAQRHQFGCGMALCGACTVHLDGQPIRSCVTPVSAVAGRRITTIEGLATPAGKAVQDAWIALDVPQCGYCQSGQIMSAAALLAQNTKRAMPTSTPPCRATSAAARPTCASATPFIRRRRSSPRSLHAEGGAMYLRHLDDATAWAAGASPAA